MGFQQYIIQSISEWLILRSGKCAENSGNSAAGLQIKWQTKVNFWHPYSHVEIIRINSNKQTAFKHPIH